MACCGRTSDRAPHHSSVGWVSVAARRSDARAGAAVARHRVWVRAVCHGANGDAAAPHCFLLAKQAAASDCGVMVLCAVRCWRRRGLLLPDATAAADCRPARIAGRCACATGAADGARTPPSAALAAHRLALVARP